MLTCFIIDEFQGTFQSREEIHFENNLYVKNCLVYQLNYVDFIPLTKCRD